MKKKLVSTVLILIISISLYANDNNADKIIEKNYKYGDSVILNINEKTAEISVYGTEQKLELKVLTQDSSMIQCEYEGSFTTCIAGYELEINKATFNGYELTVIEGKLKTIQGFSSEYILINDLILNLNGITKNGIGVGEYSYSFDGWEAAFSSIQLTEKGVEGPIVIEIYKNIHSLADIEMWNLFFSNLLVKSNGEIVTKKEDLNIVDSGIYVDNFFYTFSNGYFEKIDNKYHLVCDSSILTNYTMDEQSITLGKTTFQVDGLIQAPEFVSYTTPLRSTNDYIVYPEKVSFDGEKLILQGTLTPESWDYCNYESKEIYIYHNFFAEIKEPISEIEYGYLGWDIKGENATLGYREIYIESNSVFFHDTEINLFDHEYYTSGILSKKSKYYSNHIVPLIFDNTIISEPRFTKEGFYVTLDFPLFFDEKNNYPISFSSVLLSPDGTFSTNSVERSQRLYSETCVFDFEHGILKENGLNFYSLIITFLKNSNNQYISLEDVFISNNNGIVIKGKGEAPIQMWNMVIVADDVTIKSNEIDIIGSIQLPSSIPGSLANRMINLNECKLDFKGFPKSLDARIEGNYVIPFVDESSLLFSSLIVGCAADKPVIFFNDAKIKFYSKYGMEEIKLKYIIFDPVSGDFIYENILLTESLIVNIDDIDFVLNNLTIVEGNKLQFTGDANINGEIKKSLVEYNFDGSVTYFFSE